MLEEVFGGSHSSIRLPSPSMNQPTSQSDCYASPDISMRVLSLKFLPPPFFLGEVLKANLDIALSS